MFDFDKNDLMRVAELLVLAVVAGLIIFFVVRPLLASHRAAAAGRLSRACARCRHGRRWRRRPGADRSRRQPQESLALPGPQGPEIEQRIDMAKIEGQVKASVKSVSDFVEKHPEESISILRSWLHEA